MTLATIISACLSVAVYSDRKFINNIIGMEQQALVDSVVSLFLIVFPIPPFIQIFDPRVDI